MSASFDEIVIVKGHTKRLTIDIRLLTLIQFPMEGEQQLSGSAKQAAGPTLGPNEV